MTSLFTVIAPAYAACPMRTIVSSSPRRSSEDEDAMCATASGKTLLYAAATVPKSSACAGSGSAKCEYTPEGASPVPRMKSSAEIASAGDIPSLCIPVSALM